MTQSSSKLAGILAIAATVAMPALAVPAMAQTAPKPAAPVAPAAPGATTPMAPTATPRAAPRKQLTMKDRDRASNIIGSDVMNDHQETIGSVSDLIITQDEKVPTAVLSVGGFLGIGTKYVAVPFSDLKITNEGMMMSGATKQSLKALPAFDYSKDK